MTTDPAADLAADARARDAADPLRDYPALFHRVDASDVVSYLDGNSLGRPTIAATEAISAAVAQWSGRLIRGWDEEWFDLPITIGDRLGRVVLGAAPGQTAIGDSTTVLLYKLARGALAMRPDRTEIVLDTDNFPTDRYVLEGIAAELGLDLRWITVDPASGVEAGAARESITERTALVVLSHVAYRSGFLADAEEITRAAHDAGALVLWDLCHSVGSVPIELDRWQADFAVGCTYKYLCGGPGSPAFGYVRAAHLDGFTQPIWGWMGRRDPFEMEAGYIPADGIRRMISGTPSVLGMIAMRSTLDLIDRAGIAVVRDKSARLTDYVIELARLLLPEARIASPLDPARRGGHVTLDHPRFREVLPRLWDRGVIPDFRAPQGLRLGPSPLSTTYAEVLTGIEVIADQL
ncbi:aminotransferase class V-fold PLP-dependent enzyme [Rhodococcus olei]|uniref:Kynureninase n=1 Tax=Rhodococcus olei TaxID=2161675 RepID=A0ABP8P104_9NOCA